MSYPCHTLFKPLSYPDYHVVGCILQALKAASEQPAATPKLTHPQPSAPLPLSGDHQLTPTTANQPSSEQQAILALTGDSKAATNAADVAALAATAAAADTANGSSQSEQLLQAVAISQDSLLGPALDQKQQMQMSAEADMVVAKAAAVPRQLSQVFADEASEAESVPEEVDSGSESIEVDLSL